MNITIFGIDFDGTCVTHEYPEIGKNIGTEYVLNCLIENGHKLMLWTMRDNKPDEGKQTLQDAVNWFKQHNIELWGINENPEQKETGWSNSNKQYCNYYIDDASIGTPLLLIPELSPRPFVDWCKVAWILYKLKLITLDQYEKVVPRIINFFKVNYNIEFKKEYEIEYNI